MEIGNTLKSWSITPNNIPIKIAAEWETQSTLFIPINPSKLSVKQITIFIVNCIILLLAICNLLIFKNLKIYVGINPIVPLLGPADKNKGGINIQLNRFPKF